MSSVATAINFGTLYSTFHRSSCVQSHHSLLSFFNAPRILNRKWLQQRNRRFWFHLPRSWKSKGVISCRSTCDPELHYVLELASDSELYDLQNILFGPSYFSPLLKSLTGLSKVENVMISEDLEEREEFISVLESRFLYLAADARSTLRGWRPSYRSVLLNVRKKFSLPCSAKLSTEDLEAEIFLYLTQNYSRDAGDNFIETNENTSAIYMGNGLSKKKVHAASALMGGAGGVQSMILKGGGVLTLGKIYELLAKKFSGKMLHEAAKYQIKNEMIKKGGQIAAVNLESRLALLAAKQGVAGAATRYFGLRSMMTLLGPMLWGTLLADVVIQMLGTDYARILCAIYAFAQIRIIRTYKLPNST